MKQTFRQLRDSTVEKIKLPREEACYAESRAIAALTLP
jgi:hypothetical protein